MLKDLYCRLRCAMTKTGLPVRQALLIMKLTFIFLFFLVITAGASGYSQTITISEKNVKLEIIFKKIESQTAYQFMYRNDWMKEAKPVTVRVIDASLSQVLDLCFKDQPFTYAIVEQTIIVKRKEALQEAKVETVVTEPLVDISGRIINENGEPVEGASINIKGMAVGTTTNKNGEFSLISIPEASVLVISGTNIETFEQKLGGKQTFTLTARTKVGNMQEVVISQGYYTRKQRENTGNVVKVDGADIQKQPVSDPLLALAGRVSGLYIQETSGLPGAYSTVRIRGQNSIPSEGIKPITVNDPLYIVDGVPFGSQSLTNIYAGGGAVGNPNDGRVQGAPVYGLSPFNTLNTSDIEKIEVLKDADATAIYGSRGANGVILITTKKGKAGQTRIDFNFYTGSGKVTRKLDLLNTEQYLEMRHEALRNDNKIPGATDYDVNGTWDTTRYTDWQKVLIGNSAPFSNAQITISGGTQNTQFLVGGGYSSQGVVYPGNYSDKKASVHLNINHQSENKRFRALITASYLNNNNNLPNTDLTGLITLAPDAPAVYNADGTLNWQLKNGTATWLNPFRNTFQNNNSTTKNLMSNVNLAYRLLEGLDMKINAGYTNRTMDQKNISPATTVPPYLQGPLLRRVSLASTEVKTWIIEPQLNYTRRIAKGILDILIGGTYQENKFNSMAYGALGFASDEMLSNPASATNFSIAGVQSTLYRYNAGYGRIGYTWAEKYLLNVTGRRDGSSRFGPGRQFGNFGAVAGGWIFSKEKFVANSLRFLSFGKLRASFGSTGNDQINDYSFLSTYSATGLSYQDYSTLNPYQLTNIYLAWERVNKLEAGLELGLLKDRINFSFSYYRNRTKDQLVAYPLTYITGFNTVQANLPAIIQNQGTEFVLNTTNLHSKNFTWSTSVNLSIPTTEMVSYPDLENSSYSSVYVLGRSLFVRQRYHFTGIDPQTGLSTFETKNPNGVPNPTEDRTVTKPLTQLYFGGFQNEFRYRGFELGVFIQFVKQNGFDYRASFAMPGNYTSGTGNQLTYVLDRWQQAGDISAVQKFSTLPASNTNYLRMRDESDATITDASFIRLKNVSLSYSFPAEWLRKAHFQSLRLYIQCQNIATITNYRGLDPETRGIGLPPLQMYTGGIQFSL